MSLFFTSAPSSDRFSHRNRDLSSQNFLSHSDNTPFEAKKNSQNFNKNDYIPNVEGQKKRSELSSSSQMNSVFQSGPSFSGEKSGVSFANSPRRNLGRNPIVEGDEEKTENRGKRMVPEYFIRKSETPRKKGGRPEVDLSAAGISTVQQKEGFVPSVRLVSQNKSEEKDTVVHKRHVENNGNKGNPILQDSAAVWDRLETSRSTIRVYPEKLGAENVSVKENGDELALQRLRRVPDSHSSMNPILGDSRPISAAKTTRNIVPKFAQGNDDVIAYKYADPRQMRDEKNSNFKVGDAIRNMTPEERLDALLAEKLNTRRTFLSIRQKTTDSSSTLTDFLYDKPAAKP